MINIKDIKYSKFYGKLTSVQKASYDYSLQWKRISQDLLNAAISKKSFAKAVKWCGDAGGVSRSVIKQEFKKFSDYLWGNIPNILNGKFDLRNVKQFGGRDSSQLCIQDLSYFAAIEIPDYLRLKGQKGLTFC